MALERLREQQALIEEARLRARRRRQRYGVFTLLGMTVAVAVGFGRIGGVHPMDESGLSARFGLGPAPAPAPAINGKIAFTDDFGRLLVVERDSKLHLVAQCPASADAPVSQRASWRSEACLLGEPAWSPDGTQIAFVQGTLRLTGNSSRDNSMRTTFSLYLRDTDGRVRRLSGCGSCGKFFGGRLSWSPDGSWIVFTRDSGASSGPSLWAVNTADGTLRRLTECQLCTDVGQDWAPSGQLILFSRTTKGSSSLYTVRPDGSHLTKITTSAVAGNPQWSPDGRQIAFDSGGDKIFIVDADGSNEKLLVDGPHGSGPGLPSWSPNGTKLAFFNTPGSPGNFTAEVWTIKTDGSEKRRLFHSPCCVMSWAPPIWSPDGKKIAFAATSAGGTFVVATDGTGLRRVSTASANGITWQRLP